VSAYLVATVLNPFDSLLFKSNQMPGAYSVCALDQSKNFADLTSFADELPFAIMLSFLSLATIHGWIHPGKALKQATKILHILIANVIRHRIHVFIRIY